MRLRLWDLLATISSCPPERTRAWGKDAAGGESSMFICCNQLYSIKATRRGKTRVLGTSSPTSLCEHERFSPESVKYATQKVNQSRTGSGPSTRPTPPPTRPNLRPRGPLQVLQRQRTKLRMRRPRVVIRPSLRLQSSAASRGVPTVKHLFPE